MLSATSNTARDWVLFAVVALVPAGVLGAIAWRALHNEQAALVSEMNQAVLSNAQGAARTIEKALSESLGKVPTLSNSLRDASSQLRAVSPPFAEPVLFSPSGELQIPNTGDRSEPENEDAQCSTLALDYASPKKQARDETRRSLLTKCKMVRSASGRWLWPILALERLDSVMPQDARTGLEAELVTWFQSHGSLLKVNEREATVVEVQTLRSLQDDTKAKLLRLLRQAGGESSSLSSELERVMTTTRLPPRPDSTGIGRWKAGGTYGVVRFLPDSRVAGFVVHAGLLQDALGYIPVQAGYRLVLSNSSNASKSTGAIVGSVELAPNLVLQVMPSEPDALAKKTSRSRTIIAGLTASATLVAFVLAAYLFARMRDAKRLSELRTDFVSAVSHELRTPIASIRMLAELLEQGNIEPEDLDEVHRALVRESERLSDTVQRLLGFGRMSKGRLTISASVQRVAPILLGCVKNFERTCPNGPKIECRLDETSMAEVDADQLRMAIENLLSNTRKYAPEGGPYRLSAQTQGASVLIGLSDNGPGIAAKDHKRIFEPFERVDNRLSKATEGNGIGLSLVRFVARAHGGHAWVESEIGRGATFLIKIPRAKAEEDDGNHTDNRG